MTYVKNVNLEPQNNKIHKNIPYNLTFTQLSNEVTV